MSNVSGRLKVSQRPQRVVGHPFDSQIRETFCWIQPMFLCIYLGFIYGFSINFLRFEAGSGWWFQTDPQGHSEQYYGHPGVIPTGNLRMIQAVQASVYPD